MPEVPEVNKQDQREECWLAPHSSSFTPHASLHKPHSSPGTQVSDLLPDIEHIAVILLVF